MLETIITSSVLITVLILLRYLFKGKINLRLQYALWLLVAIRLLMLFSVFDSSLSVLNIIDIGSQTEQIESPGVLVQSETAGQVGVNVVEGITATPDDSENYHYTMQDKTSGSGITPHEKASFSNVLYTVWIIGAIAIGLWFILQNIWFYTRLRKTREAAKIPNRLLTVYLSQYVKSPCLFGLFSPAIYLRPDSLTDNEALEYILAHEETHYKHGDHLWSYLRCVCIALHWFNPLVWYAAVLSRRDCEIACDESTLNRIGGEHRKAYGNMLINMIACSSKPSDLLCGATTMTSGQSGIKERITMIARSPRMMLGTFFAVILITVAVVGCTFTGAKKEEPTPPSGKHEATESVPEEELSLYERFGMKIAIPKEYGEQLLIDPAGRAEYDGKIAESTLINVYQKFTYEKYPGAGWLFSIARCTEAQYEQFLCSDGSGMSFFAKDDKYYYGFFSPTDVQAPDDYEAYSALFSDVGDFVKNDFLKRNGLTPYSDKEFFGRTYTYDGEHVFIKYYPYYAVNGSKDEVWTLILSHPVKQGSTGIWCVERWRDQSGSIYPYFPNENGTPSGEYYASQQLEADAGRQMSLLDPEQVAMAFAEKVFVHGGVNRDSFERAENFGISGSDPDFTLSLNTFPIDFPFGMNLTEKSRESFLAETYGKVTVIESDGLQVKYLNNTEGLYHVYSIRAVKEGYFNTGVAIGDPEEKLWDHWEPMQLKKLDSLSYDDEVWFDDGYDYAYAYTQRDSTRNILYLIKGGRVTGIEVINGLDGSMY